MIYLKHKILQAYLKFAVYDDALDFLKGRRLHQRQQIFHSIIFITSKVIMGKFNSSIHLSQLKMKKSEIRPKKTIHTCLFPLKDTDNCKFSLSCSF